MGSALMLDVGTAHCSRKLKIISICQEKISTYFSLHNLFTMPTVEINFKKVGQGRIHRLE